MSSSQSTRQSRRLSSAATHSTLLTADAPRTKSTSPYDRQFQQVLIDNGIYPHGYRYSDGRVPPKPDNWDQFGQMLARPRPSLSPSRFGDAEFDDFLEVKGPDGSAAVARRQACYDGALGARGMHKLQAFGQSAPTYDNNEYTVASVYYNG
jgi:hypothetical protein